MEYGKIIAVTGLPGLYELLNSKSDGGIIRSLDDKTTRFVTSRKHNFSHLESIEVYTVKENINLIELFHAMEKAGKDVPDGKDVATLKKYFEEVYPDLDFDRVYNSDLKKMAKWFQILKANNVELKLTAAEEEAEEEENKEEETSEAKEKPAAKKAAKKSAEKKDDKIETEEAEKPVKKAAKKKAATSSKEEENDDKKPAKKAAKKKSS